MTEHTPGTHVVYPNPLAPWCSHRGVVYDTSTNPNGTYDVMSYSGRQVVIPAEDLEVVTVPTGQVEVGTRVIAIAIEYPSDLVPYPYARHAIGFASVSSTRVSVHPDQHDKADEDFPADAVFAIPVPRRTSPGDGDEVFLSVRVDGSDPRNEDAKVEPVHGDVSGVSAFGAVRVLTVLGQRMGNPVLLAVDDRVEPRTWVVLTDGETGAVTRYEPFRTENRRHTWGYTYTVALPAPGGRPPGYLLESKAWSGEHFDGFLIARVESERIAATALPVGSASQVTAYPGRT